MVELSGVGYESHWPFSLSPGKPVNSLSRFHSRGDDRFHRQRLFADNPDDGEPAGRGNSDGYRRAEAADNDQCRKA